MSTSWKPFTTSFPANPRISTKKAQDHATTITEILYHVFSTFQENAYARKTVQEDEIRDCSTEDGDQLDRSVTQKYEMYISVYIYRVPKENVAAFLRVQKEAAAIYRRYGALVDENYELVQMEAKYGCSTFLQALDVGKGEEVFFGLSQFRDRAHHDQVMRRVDKDERIDELYEEVTKLLDVARVVRGEFKSAVSHSTPSDDK